MSFRKHPIIERKIVVIKLILTHLVCSYISHVHGTTRRSFPTEYQFYLCAKHKFVGLLIILRGCPLNVTTPFTFTICFVHVRLSFFLVFVLHFFAVICQHGNQTKKFASGTKRNIFCVLIFILSAIKSESYKAVCVLKIAYPFAVFPLLFTCESTGTDTAIFDFIVVERT